MRGICFMINSIKSRSQGQVAGRRGRRERGYPNFVTEFTGIYPNFMS
jgi:hypothetical protein